jgi:hypothetical protein
MEKADAVYLWCMYPKLETGRIKQEFWTRFGQYMAPVLSSEGEKINWVNYKTGERNISFRMEADNRSASIAIVCDHPDELIRDLYFEQLLDLKNMLTAKTDQQWNWQRAVHDEGRKVVSKVYQTLEDVSIFRQEDWPEMISFLKGRIIALDAFWSQAKYAFEALR